MQDQETFLEDTHTQLNELLKPFRSEARRRQNLSKFIEQVLRATKRDAIFQQAELLAHKTAAAVEAEPGLEATTALFTALRSHAEAQIDAYRSELITDLRSRCAEIELPLSIDFPRFASRPGISGTIDFAARLTTINGTKLKSVDPRRIVAALNNLDKRLYGRSFDAQAFIDGLFATYSEMVGNDLGASVNAQDLYLKHVIGKQSKSFFQNLDKTRFRGYPLDEFSVDLWRFFSSDISRTQSGHVLRLRPGRGGTLWLLDSEGEARQIATFAFQEAS